VAVRAAPERAEAAFDAISATGRDAMVQLRRMLGVLREGGAESAAEGPAPREPQPGLAELPALLERVRSGDLDVVYRTAGVVRPVPDVIGATVFRVVQEALTNTLRHADARTVAIQLTYVESELIVRVTDDGRGPQPGSGGGGHGLIGIRERAAVHGGTAAVGAGPDGRGFEVRVRIPVPAAVEVGR
jgi:signal transduction histidine kinase